MWEKNAQDSSEDDKGKLWALLKASSDW